ncbi:MAG: MoxR family ATPase [Spirochaetales bacterium]|nr:MoxR family ATPase [Spirochaetales bacterium]
MEKDRKNAAEKEEGDLERLISDIRAVKLEIAKVMVGQDEVIEEVLVCLFAGGHALLEGVPGLGKTSLIKSLGRVLDLSTSRIQFTPDLMPADIIGTPVLIRDSSDDREIRFQPGPVFANVVLADEINRATPKTQSALLEAMQEEGVTVGGVTHSLEQPFIVLATQNPIEMAGTYPLPEAQMDRFFFKIRIQYPSFDEVLAIVDRTTSAHNPEMNKVLNASRIVEIRRILRTVPVSEEVKRYAVRIVLATHPEKEGKGVGSYVKYGSSPRGAQSLILAGKVWAVLQGRPHVDFSDIRKAVMPALRHRLIMSFEGEAEGISPEMVLQDILQQVPEGKEKNRR